MTVTIKDPVIKDISWEDLGFGDYFTLSHPYWVYHEHNVCRKIGDDTFILVSSSNKFENSSFDLKAFDNATYWKLIPESMTFIKA